MQRKRCEQESAHNPGPPTDRSPQMARSLLHHRDPTDQGSQHREQLAAPYLLLRTRSVCALVHLFSVLAKCHTGVVGKVQTIDEYIEGFAGPGRQLLEQLRALANTTAPEATEAIKWSNAAWVHPSGTILFMVAGYTLHANFAFTPSTREAFDADLAGFTTGKGSVKLPYSRPVPVDLLRRMIAFRVREHEEDGVLWM